MMCYRDMSFCENPNCTCERRLTPAIEAAAERWWNPKDEPDKRGKAPIAVIEGCEVCLTAKGDEA